MVLACLDLEGVLLPEIWINVAIKTGIEELKLTTRDISDYDVLMQKRLGILEENKITLKDIQEVIGTLDPLEGAPVFLKQLQEKFQVVILSDTFYQFAMPLMKKLDFPTLFCHNLEIIDGKITGYKLRQKDSKRQAVIGFRSLNFNTIATGDSYNDTTMLAEADRGILFRPPQNVIDEFPQYPVATEYSQLLEEFQKAEAQI
jgi:phosphoserine/homoserine phosphotransferase